MPDRKALLEMFADDAGRPLKMQENKPMLSLVPREGIEALAGVYEYGLTKYSRDSWRQFTPEQAQACLPDAALRHLLAYCSGESVDPDSGLSHLAQTAWNCLTLLIIAERVNSDAMPKV